MNKINFMFLKNLVTRKFKRTHMARIIIYWTELV